MIARAPLVSSLVVATATFGCAPPPAANPEATTLASPAEPLELSDGHRLVLPSEHGKVFVLGFYGVWCPVSRKMLRSLGTVSTPARLKKGLVVVAVDEEDARPDAERFARAAGHSGPIGFDSEGNFTRAMKLDTVPALVLVGRDGVVRRVHAGYHGDEELTALGREVDALLAAPKDAATKAGSDADGEAAPAAPTASAAAPK
jgi:thiol-disulfide isomerase/thioredoxin